jgi:diguanylate cyclase (GGDEF)-like protein
MERPWKGSALATAVALAIAGSGGCGRAPVRPTSVLTSVSQIRSLPKDGAYAGIEAHLRGVVTYAYTNDDACFIQDSTGGIRIQLRRGQMVGESGEVMEVWGTVVSVGAAPALAESRFTLLGPAPFPPAKPLQSALAEARDGIYERVSVTGVVQSARDTHNDITVLQLRDSEGPVEVKAISPAFSDPQSLIDAEIRIEGVLIGTRGTEADTVMVGAPALTEAHVTLPAPPVTATAEVTAASLRGLRAGQLPAHRVRLRGQLRASPSGGYLLEDASGRLPVWPAADALAPLDGAHEIAGFAAWRNGEVVIEGASNAAGDPQRAQTLPVQDTARAVHQLSAAAAAQRYPVKLRGVVTYSDPFNGILFIEDRTDGMFVSVEDPNSVLLRPRDLVEVDGETAPGDFAPSVTRARARIEGHAPLPRPQPNDFESAFQGQRDCRWVELSGVMQSVAPGSHESVAQMVYGTHRFQARILAPVDALSRFVNADVKLRGVCGALFNGRRQMLGIVIYVPGESYIHVVREAPQDFSALPLQSVESLLQFSPSTAAGHRVRLRGIITATEPSGMAWVEDTTGAIGIRDYAGQQAAVGDLAEVVGFPAPGVYSPILANAMIRRIGLAKSPSPAPFTAAQLLDGSHDGQLVAVEGGLVDRTFSADRLVLLLKSGRTQFTASMQARSPFRMPETGAVLRVAGICSTLADDSRESVAPRSFEIRMRSPQDLVILKQPSWLTFGRLLPIFQITLAIAAVALFWASRLRRRLQAQANTLMQKTLQLEKEHHQTTRALRRAQEAEVMEQAHKNVLELVAQDEDLNGVLMRLAQAVEEHCPGVSCAIQLHLPERQRLGASPSLPADWQNALSKIAVEDFAGAGVHPLADLSISPAWGDIAHAPAGQVNRVSVAPIERESRVIGVVLAFLAGETVLRRAQMDFLASASKLAALAVGRRVLYDQLSHQAQHDELTGLENRAALMARLAREISLAAATGRLLGVIYIDLDNFKYINDTFGHAAGDGVLKAVAQRMEDCVRRSDALARLGGDEFVIVLPNVGQRGDVERIASQIVTSLAHPIPLSGQTLMVGASAGTAVYPQDGGDPDALLTAADHRMYHEKGFRRYTGSAEPPGSGESRMVT